MSKDVVITIHPLYLPWRIREPSVGVPNIYPNSDSLWLYAILRLRLNLPFGIPELILQLKIQHWHCNFYSREVPLGFYTIIGSPQTHGPSKVICRESQCYYKRVVGLRGRT